MTTTPPDTEPTRFSNRGLFDRPERGAAMAVGNAELLVYLGAVVLAAIVIAIDDELTSAFWLDFFKWATAAYLLSRGIAKASRVFDR